MISQTGRIGYAIGLLVFLVALSSLQADVIFFRNQRYVKGTIISQSATSVLLRDVSGKTITISKARVRRILYISPEKMQEMDRRAEAKDRLRRTARIREEAQRTEQQRKEREATEARRKELANRKALLRRQSLQQAEQRNEIKRQQRLATLWRSALLPGWGQVYRNQTNRGYWVGGAFTGSLLLLYFFNARYASAVEEQRTATNLTWAGFQYPAVATAGFLAAREAHQQAESNARLARGFSITMVLIYVANLADAWSLAPGGQMSSVRQPDTRGGLHFAATPDRRPTAKGRHFGTASVWHSWNF